MNIAICVITYNRVNSLKRLLLSLSQSYYNCEVPLIISVDKSNTNEVEVFADNYEWRFGNKTVVKHQENLGLRKHILQCGDFLHQYDALVVLEDDTMVAPSYFYYVQQCVEEYYDNDKIAGISLYSFETNYHNTLPFSPIKTDSDVFLMQIAQSWGQIWMKKQWFNFIDWYNQNNEEFSILPHLPKSICRWPKSSWLKYHSRYCIEQKKYFIYPYNSLSTNFSDIGVHSSEQSYIFQVKIQYGKKESYLLKPSIQYDGFFENELLYKTLNLSQDNLCIDIYGEKRNRENKHFYLTTELLNYKIINSYGLLLKPIEMNVIYNIPGYDIFLYDSTSTVNNNFKRNNKYNKTNMFLCNLNDYLLKKQNLISVPVKKENIVKQITKKTLFVIIKKIKTCISFINH